jgi:hypothetical protein
MPLSFFADATALQLVIPIVIGLAMAGLFIQLRELRSHHRALLCCRRAVDPDRLHVIGAAR